MVSGHIKISCSEVIKVIDGISDSKHLDGIQSYINDLLSPFNIRVIGYDLQYRRFSMNGVIQDMQSMLDTVMDSLGGAKSFGYKNTLLYIDHACAGQLLHNGEGSVSLSLLKRHDHLADKCRHFVKKLYTNMDLYDDTFFLAYSSELNFLGKELHKDIINEEIKKWMNTIPARVVDK